MNIIWRNMLIALGLAMLVTAAALAYFTSKENAEAQKNVITRVEALVSNKDLEAGEIITANDVSWKSVPPSDGLSQAVVKGKMSELEVIGNIVQRPITRGEVINLSAITKPDMATNLSYKLNPGFRAVTISVDSAQGASGRILPNDRIDIVLMSSGSGGGLKIPMLSSGGGAMGPAKTVLRNVRVIAISGKTKPDKPEQGAMEGSTFGGSTMTLELTPREAEFVLAASGAGRLAFLLRRKDESGDIGTSANADPAMLLEEVSASAAATPATAPSNPMGALAGVMGNTAAAGGANSSAPAAQGVDATSGVLIVRGGTTQ